MIITAFMEKTKISLHSTGYCEGDNRIVHAGEQSFRLKFQAVWALIEHPVLGRILFDTGYSKRFAESTRSFPYSLYALATPVYFKEENSCINQLRRLDLDSASVDHLVISHFHADHIGGLKDFKDIPLWCSKKGMEHFLNTPKLLGLCKGYLKSLVPDDLASVANFPEEKLKPCKIGPFDAWAWSADVWFVSLPGHCRGQLGLFLKNTNLGDVFLAADASWSSKAFRERIYPSRIVSVFVDNYRELKETVDKLHAFYLENKEVLIVPTHCAEIANIFLSDGV
jgi:glyoxylase-like metal-dependent hydrolase (beta-lactamase superfamily II)